MAATHPTFCTASSLLTKTTMVETQTQSSHSLNHSLDSNQPNEYENKSNTNKSNHVHENMDFSALSSTLKTPTPLASERVLCSVDWATNEMLLQVLRWLNPTELLKTRLVSRQWRTASDSNSLWKHICAARWPSCAQEPSKIFIELTGGFRQHYIASLPRRRSNLSDIILTMDICSTSYEYFSSTQAVAGTSLSGKDAVWDNGRMVFTLAKPWRIDQKPYRFKTLTDILALRGVGDGGDEAETPNTPLCMPEFRLKIGAMHKTLARRIHVATLEEGMNMRTRVWYDALRAEAAASADIHRPHHHHHHHHNYNNHDDDDNNDNNDNDNNSDDEDNHNDDNHNGNANHNFDDNNNHEVDADIDEEVQDADPKPAFSFSGQLLLPQLYNGNSQHLVDVQLFGDSVVTPNKLTSHHIREIHLGPFFNTLQMDGLESMVATRDDVVDMLDLKFGVFAEDQLTDLGKPTF